MAFLSLRKGRQLVGVDVGTGAIKVALLKGGRNKFVLEKLGISEVPQGTFQGGLIADMNTLVDVLKALWRNLDLGKTPAAVAISGKEVIIDTPELEISGKMGRNFYARMREQAREYIQYPLDELYFDCDILSSAGSNSGKALMLLACVKKAILDDLVLLFRRAEIGLSVVDISYYALFNGFETISGLVKRDGVIGIMNVGATSTDLVISVDGIPRHCRTVMRGMDDLIFQVADTLGVSFEEVQGSFRGSGILQTVPEKDFKETVSYALEQWLGEVKGNIDYLRDFGGLSEIEDFFVCGGPACMSGFETVVKKYVGVRSCRIYNPIEGLSLGKNIDRNYAISVGPQFGVAIGLALRKEGDKKI
ncbi:type IV pilus assembly protein PilM [Thermodesulforhabdus norvegica]|uniref:Type IV pilus assembly protein PilM n=1 Tax=Thermodesulforhabdus norvegica TaxID=39841 RepID=A0A1I4WCL0_9BACT|nr:type IV pilus assembly protein PilM [Thermodesulforhabdus norvegica]SFN11165.1 type IV pilus assembly protein PilM [Thermodesulforhabdus norvegica]